MSRREGGAGAPFTVEILAVGTELLSGSVANTDAQVLSRALFSLGLAVRWHTVVGDDARQVQAAAETARRRAHILITTGGLGPTYDDLTREAVCAAFGLALRPHPAVLEDLGRRYPAGEIPPNTARQALLPEGCEVFFNTAGTAPGCAFFREGVHVVMLPGPPGELEPMLRRSALPYLRRLCPGAVVSHDLRIFGMGESAVDRLLRPWMETMENPTLAPYALPCEVRLCCTARAATAQEAEALAAPVLERARQALGDVVYGVDIESLPALCLTLLKARRLTFATAESCTGGAVAEAITALPGASVVYRGGVVSYWTEVKSGVLGVEEAVLSRFGAVSQPVALAMARGARRLTGAELALSVTGVAGPEGDDRGNPVGRVFIALSTPEGDFCRRMEAGPQPRRRIQALAVCHAYDMLRRYLTGLGVEGAFAPGREEAGAKGPDAVNV